MARFLGKITASMATRGGSSFVEHYNAVDDDLSTWELVNPSQSDDEDLYSFDSDDVTSEGGDVVTDEPESKLVREEEEEDEDEEDARRSRGLGVLDAIISIQSLSVSPPVTFPVEMTRNHVYHDGGDGSDDGDGDDVYDMDDVDDELVPWKLKNRFGKQRIRKMGKRSGPKLNKSKKLPFYQNRPGCLHGKHGFGVQHAFI